MRNFSTLGRRKFLFFIASTAIAGCTKEDKNQQDAYGSYHSKNPALDHNINGTDVVDIIATVFCIFTYSGEIIGTITQIKKFDEILKISKNAASAVTSFIKLMKNYFSGSEHGDPPPNNSGSAGSDSSTNPNLPNKENLSPPKSIKPILIKSNGVNITPNNILFPGITFSYKIPQFLIKVTNKTGQDFLAHNVYGLIKKISEPQPTSIDDVQGFGSLPSFVISAAAGDQMEGRFQVLPQGFDEFSNEEGYVLYTWCIPSEKELTEYIIRNEFMIGSIFFICDKNNKSLTASIIDNLDLDHNFSPQYQYVMSEGQS